MTLSERIANDLEIKFKDFHGNIGMVCNSAGLCMATNDAIVKAGGAPANFSDLGGTAIHEQIDSLFHIVNKDEAVRVIFINCYGGITNIKKLIATLRMGLVNGIITKPVIIRAKGLES